MDHRQQGKIRACPFAAPVREMSQLTACKRASLSNSRLAECGLVVLKSPSWKLPWLLSSSSVAEGRRLHEQTWNLPEAWTAVVTLWLPLLASCSPFLEVAKQRSHFSCHTQVKWLHLLLSSQHMLLWCDPLLD